jgi:ATP-binding cassette subfamily B protein
MDGTLVEQLGGIEYVRAANTHKEEASKLEAVAERVRSQELRHHVAMSFYDLGKALNEGLFFILVVIGAIALATSGRMQSGDIITFAMLFGSVLVPLREVHRIIDEAHESSLRVGDLINMMAEPVDESFAPGAGRVLPILSTGVPVIEVRDLYAHYGDSHNGRQALAGLSMCIRHGETIGIAGRSGSGKTTLIKLLLRLSHPTAGSLLIGGVPIGEVSRESIAALVGYVGQVPYAFAGTIAQNISYGCANATMDQIRSAARLACLNEDIERMPGGYESMVAERGGNLSGGQLQRLALARVFIRNPPILILDEATSALDNISERLVQSAVAAARVDRTVLMVAHRLSTLADADRIVVLDEGRIVETGTSDELLQLNGSFARLARPGERDTAATGVS